MQDALAWLSLPEYGLSSVFVVSFVSATLIPLGSEPVVYGMVKLRPDLFWETIAVATLGNTLGGASTTGWAAAPSGCSRAACISMRTACR